MSRAPMRALPDAAHALTPGDVDSELALWWLLRLEELHVDELAARECVPVALVMATCAAFGWTPPRSRWWGRRPDMHERLVMWNHGLTWEEIAHETKYNGTSKACASAVRFWAISTGHPMRKSIPWGGRGRKYGRALDA
jgi:hypothetical protein